MQTDTDFRFPVEDSFSMGNQSFSCPSTASFSSTPSAYDPFTPTSSRRSTPADVKLEYDEASYPLYPMGLSPSQTSPNNYIFGPDRLKAEPMSFTDALPTTPMKRVYSTAIDGMVDLSGVHSPAHMLPLTPSNSFDMYNVSPATMQPTSFMMTPSRSLSGSDLTDPSAPWQCATESPINFFHQPNFMNDDLQQQISMHQASRLTMGPSTLPSSGSPERMPLRDRRKLARAQRRGTVLNGVQEKSLSLPVHDTVPASKNRCDYPGCNKAYQRNEHLKRHIQTSHLEVSFYTCEFCRKNTFNRQDNLNNHRKLHARPNSRNRGVEFIPAAVPIIEAEERSRKKRQPSKRKFEIDVMDDEGCTEDDYNNTEQF